MHDHSLRCLLIDIHMPLAGDRRRRLHCVPERSCSYSGRRALQCGACTSRSATYRVPQCLPPPPNLAPRRSHGRFLQLLNAADGHTGAQSIIRDGQQQYFAVSWRGRTPIVAGSSSAGVCVGVGRLEGRTRTLPAAPVPCGGTRVPPFLQFRVNLVTGL